jgi:hypothetical protein
MYDLSRVVMPGRAGRSTIDKERGAADIFRDAGTQTPLHDERCDPMKGPIWNES